MPELIDARGLGCGQPFILSKNALELHNEVIVLVNETTALENLKILGRFSGCIVEINENAGNGYVVSMKKLSD